ncbi:MAG: cyclic nucleotide-binding domain-containing protein [Verrucomicrobiae bacterium]|jgi:CRP-like cAMP-binding protein|nr:cyclic nucleotide-binding domain-containing protein [Verrucomicrobiae bacterium]
MHSLNDKTLKVSAAIERREMPDGTRLLKQRRTGEYLALAQDDIDILRLFNGERTVQEVFHDVLVSGERPKIREFYDLVFDAFEKGFLFEGAKEDRSARRVGHDWPVMNSPISALFLPIFLILAGVVALTQCVMSLTPSPVEWLLLPVFTGLTLSFSYLLAGAALAAYGRQVYRPVIRMDYGLPYFWIDTRDAFMGGRQCETLVALNTVAAPFAIAFIAWQTQCVPLYLGAWIAAILLSAPFGHTAAHQFLYAAFRKAHFVPRNADDFIENKLLSQMFNWKEELAEEKYFIAYSTYAILWLGVIFRFSSELMNEQASLIFDDPNAMIPVAALAAVVAAPLLYGGWLTLRNLWRCTAPKLFRAEAKIGASARASWKPDTDELVNFLESIILFAEMPREDLKRVAEAMSFIPVKPGTLIIREHDRGDLFFVVYHGEVEVLKENDAGVASAVARLGKADVFGEIALLEKSSRTSSIQAVTKCDLLALKKDDFDHLIVDTLGAQKIRQLVQVCAFLRRSPLFKDWPSRSLIKIANEFTFEDHAAGNQVISEGERNEFFYLIYEGNFQVSKDGKNVATLGPGDFCGEISLLRGTTANASVTAAQPSRALKLDKESFLDLVSQDFVMALALDREAERRDDETGGLE